MTGNNLFSRKDLYLMEHTADGRSTRVAAIPKRKRRKVMDDNMHLMEGMTFSDGYPQLSSYSGSVDFEAVAYSDRKRHDGHNQAAHFFLDDYRFRDAVWYNLEYTTYTLSKFDYLITPDLSLWRDLPTEFYNEKNVFRTRFIGAYWQMAGYKVIPTASWGGLSSFAYCFNGLPDDSVIAVSGMGNRRDGNAYSRWCYGMRRLEQEKKPSLIMVYGREVEVPGLHTPLKYIPDFISTNLRK